MRRQVKTVGEDLDDVDRQILELLCNDARLSADRSVGVIGVSAGTVGTRVRRLEHGGVIRGYRAVVEPAAVGRPLGFMVGLRIAQGTPLDGILEELVAMPAVDEVMVVTGRWDLMVVGRVADPGALNALLTKGSGNRRRLATVKRWSS